MRITAQLRDLWNFLLAEEQESPTLERRVWHKRPFSIVLLYAFLLLLYLWNRSSHIPPPGEAVAALAVAAAIMTLLGEMKGKEKVAWILILFGFLELELTAIKVERNAQEEIQKEARREQLEHFNDIGNGIKASISESDRNFTATMKRTNEVLENVTGGNSFAYVSPQNFSGDQFPGVVWNNGEQALVGLTLTIAHTSDPVQVWGAAFFKPIFIGTVGPHEHAPIPDFLFQPRADPKSGQDNYWIMLSAQNGTAQQSLYFRRNRLHPQQWAYSFTIVRAHYAERPQEEKMLTKADTRPRKGHKQELLLYRAWSDDMEAATVPQKP